MLQCVFTGKTQEYSELSQPQEAAVLAGEYIRTHKSTFGGGSVNAQQKLFIAYK